MTTDHGRWRQAPQHRPRTLAEQAAGFRHRAADVEGSLDEFERAVELEFTITQRRRERRASLFRLLLAIPAFVWVLLAVVAFVALAMIRSWVDQHPVEATVLTVLAVAVPIAYIVMNARSQRPLPPTPMAPPDAWRRTPHVQLDSMRTYLPAEARALHDALDPGRAKRYLEALELRVIAPPSRTAYQGLDRITAQLPSGRVAAGDIDLRRFADGLGLDASQVRRGPDVPGTLVVELLHVRPADMPVPAWPALGAATDWESPVPVGVDETGAPVALPVAGRRWLIAGMSGSGKTRLVRTVALWAAGDPTARLHIIDCKGSPSLRCLTDRAVYFHAGRPDAAVVDHLRSIQREMEARYRRGVTAGDPWIVAVIDEAQNLWREAGAAEVVEDIARMGREARIGLVIGSQTPDKASVPTAIAGEADVRVAMRLAHAWAPGMVLGDYDRDCSTLPAGHAWVSDTTAGRVVRVACHDVDDDDAAWHLDALPARPALPAGMPVLVAGDDEDDDEEPGLLDDVAATIGGRPGVAWDVLARELGLEESALRADLRALGVSSKAFRPGGGAPAVRGVTAAEVDAAMARAVGRT